MQPDSTIIDRFWSFVAIGDGDGCWLWTGGPHGTQYRYGQFQVKGRGSTVGAHRFAYLITHGAIPDGLHICHHCDTPRCVRPDHLYAGTARDNVRDCIERGRRRLPFGENHKKSKLTMDHVVEMRRRYAAGGISFARLAHDYDVTTMAAFHAVRGHHWRSVADPLPVNARPHRQLE